jgi:hypothetical protein
MATKIVKDSGNWASIWVKEVNLGNSAAALPGGSAAAAINQPYIVGSKVGIITDTPILRSDGNYWATIDMACLVRVTGMSGTGTDGQIVYITSAFALTLTVGSNVKAGFLDRAKVNTGDDAWVQLVPGIGS